MSDLTQVPECPSSGVIGSPPAESKSPCGNDNLQDPFQRVRDLEDADRIIITELREAQREIQDIQNRIAIGGNSSLSLQAQVDALQITVDQLVIDLAATDVTVADNTARIVALEAQAIVFNDSIGENTTRSTDNAAAIVDIMERALELVTHPTTTLQGTDLNGNTNPMDPVPSFSFLLDDLGEPILDDLGNHIILTD